MLEDISKLYNEIIRTGYTPRIWREMKLVFIPKAGKDDYASPKSFRPITLSNFLLKGLERVVLWQLETGTLREPLKN